MVVHTDRNEMNRLTRKYGTIFTMSVWSFVIVIATLLFFFAGYWIDVRLDTKPTFMLGLFALALFMTVGRFYWEAWHKKNLH
ncbi:MAG: AtpZ/AtpI family protein [Syntrophales bacterium]|jgi:hypothetical protein|nr:AtpZ/AtpI family protein [Syntrophales bacterium]MCK9527572.1 AtpZ/AtpI family protein [Syntrophales bacterium]MDX9922189.1 AtpZ/AtpI family protein [Syntrophales bacterium]